MTLARLRDDRYEQFVTAVDELAMIWPQLGAALARDQGTGGQPVVSTSSAAESAAPVNLAVSAVLLELEAAIPSMDQWARTVVGEPPMRTIAGMLRGMPALYQRMTATTAHAEAAELRRAVHRWHRIARRAIGLSKPARPLHRHGQPVSCPLHDDPVTGLLQPGDEGTIHAATAPERITWQRDGRVYCPHCRASWTPQQYGLLGRMCAEADERRAAPCTP